MLEPDEHVPFLRPVLWSWNTGESAIGIINGVQTRKAIGGALASLGGELRARCAGQGSARHATVWNE